MTVLSRKSREVSLVRPDGKETTGLVVLQVYMCYAASAQIQNIETFLSFSFALNTSAHLPSSCLLASWNEL